MSSLRFGTFLPPIHPVGENPTWWLRHDLDLLVHLDRLGFDEAWIGEHHSTGREIISAPEIFIAAAAEHTTRLRLGTGMTTIPYHNPLWVADRMVLLDHLTRGRVMLGVGPGSLPADGAMIGLTPTQSRELLDVNIDVILRLLAGESVTATAGVHELVDARLQLRPYTEPRFEVAVAALTSPTGARLAGTYGLSLISIGANAVAGGVDVLSHHWGIAEERARHAGQVMPDRSRWRLVNVVHIAETREQAQRDVEFGIHSWLDHLRENAAAPGLSIPTGSTRDMIDFVAEAGMGLIGTPDDLSTQIQSLIDRSGGFGTILLQAHNMANPAATWRSWELIAQRVMPHFQGGSTTHAQSTLNARAHTLGNRDDATLAQQTAVEHMTHKYDTEVADTKRTKGVSG